MRRIIILSLMVLMATGLITGFCGCKKNETDLIGGREKVEKLQSSQKLSLPESSSLKASERPVEGKESSTQRSE